jgi:Na+-transporting methylmalonyl-CoA/oxaloacetate decarboxylase beta subunit
MISAPSSILACATCLADKGSLVGQAQGFAILFMLGVLAFMFACAGGIVFAMVRQQRKASRQDAVAV